MTDSSIPLKQCSRKDQCINPEGSWLPLTDEYFFRNARSSCGFKGTCKVCLRQYKREWQRAHPERVKAWQAEFRATHKEYNQERRRQWHVEHREESNEASRQYYAEHKEETHARNKRWREENPKQKRALKLNARARTKNADGVLTAADIRDQYKRQKGKCFYCGCKMSRHLNNETSQTVDHIVPLARGGRNAPDNIVLACRSCNSRKHTKLLHEWNETNLLI